MKARLLYRERDFDWNWTLQAAAAREATRTRRRHQTQDFDPHAGFPWNTETLIKDLELNTLFTAMARDDDLIFEVAKAVVLGGADNDLGTIRYRQNVLQDCLKHPSVVRELYAIAVDAADKEKKHSLGLLTRYPDFVLRWAIELLDALLGPMAADLLPEEVQGTGYGVLATVNGLGDFLSSIVVGFLWTAISPAAGFLYAAILSAAGGLVILRLR